MEWFGTGVCMKVTIEVLPQGDSSIPREIQTSLYWTFPMKKEVNCSMGGMNFLKETWTGMF